MRCEKRGDEYPSKRFFATNALCRACFEQRDESERREIQPVLESVASESAGPRTVA
jgi:hypothetical protein